MSLDRIRALEEALAVALTERDQAQCQLTDLLLTNEALQRQVRLLMQTAPSDIRELSDGC